MTITPLSGTTSGDEVWGDFSGGAIVFAISTSVYTSYHLLRVIPFDTSGTGLFTAPPAGTTSGLQQEADNLAALIAGLYGSDTTVSAVYAQQTNAGHTGQYPYAFSFATSSTATGSSGTTSYPPPNVLNYNGRGGDGSRWRLTLPGFTTALGAGVAKTLYANLTGNPQALAKYLVGATNGGVHAVKTNVVTHNGVVLTTALSVTNTTNKRLRRHFHYI